MGYRDQTNYQQPHTLFIQGPETLLRPFTEKYPPPPRFKAINKCLRQLTNKSSPPTINAIDRYNKYLHKAANLAEMEIEPLSPTNITSRLAQTIHDLKQIKHAIWAARNLEKLQEQNKRINF